MTVPLTPEDIAEARKLLAHLELEPLDDAKSAEAAMLLPRALDQIEDQQRRIAELEAELSDAEENAAAPAGCDEQTLRAVARAMAEKIDRELTDDAKVANERPADMLHAASAIEPILEEARQRARALPGLQAADFRYSDIRNKSDGNGRAVISMAERGFWPSMDYPGWWTECQFFFSAETLEVRAREAIDKLIDTMLRRIAERVAASAKNEPPAGSRP